MYYEPPINCECGYKMPKWISWSDDNPGRRYHKCRFRQIGGTGGCELYYWLDDPIAPFIRRLIVDLRSAVWEKIEENKRLMEAVGATNGLGAGAVLGALGGGATLGVAGGVVALGGGSALGATGGAVALGAGCELYDGWDGGGCELVVG
ncbi:hypothetical protein D1007_13403 [Hordeum vulgare]|nr:hypothetical protein D1007_13403 [Hordeum vulgare]